MTVCIVYDIGKKYTVKSLNKECEEIFYSNFVNDHPWFKLKNKSIRVYSIIIMIVIQATLILKNLTPSLYKFIIFESGI